MFSILIVEDDPVIRQTIEYVLRREGFDTRATGDGQAALAQAAEFSPDLVLLDLMLPGLDGIHVAEQLRTMSSKVAIIMVTALDQKRDKVRGLDAGADDYITKPFSMEELLARIRANLRRAQEHVSDEEQPIRRGDLVISPKSFKATVAGEPVELRRKEFQLLLVLTRNDGCLCTRQMLAAEIWGQEHFASSRTIDVHIRRLRQVIETPSAFCYIHTIHGLGYRFEVSPKPVGNGQA